MKSLKNWILHNKWEFVMLLIILGAASFFRFYRLSEYMMFLGDEGRDALVIKGILVDHHFTLLGPPTSVGNIYLGPLYYYMMAIPMAIWWLNPVAASGMVATIGVAAVFLVYFLARKWFGVLPAILSATLYAISPVNIIYSQFSWNPNPAPFFALLSILGFYQAKTKHDSRWLILTGAALAFVVQMHYLALILLPIFALFWLYEIKIDGKKDIFVSRNAFFAAVIFVLLMLPLFLFDLRHNFLNTRAIFTIFTDRESAVNINIFNNFLKTFPIYNDKLIGRYLAGQNSLISLLLSGLVAISVFLPHKNKWPYFVLGVWLFVGILFLTLYKFEIYDHYLGFLNPVPFLLLGGLAAYFKGFKQVILVIFLIILLGFVNLQKSPLLSPPNNQLARTQEIAKFIVNESNNKPFNFALIAQNNYDSAYQFYLGQYGNKPREVSFEITDQLFVVCENTICDPIGHPKFEIAGFGWAQIEFEQNVVGTKVFKLVKNPDGRKR